MCDLSAPVSFQKKSNVGALFLSIAVLVLVLDQILKAWVYFHLPIIDSFAYIYPYGGIGVFRDFGGIEFSLSYTTNTGAAWGMLGTYQIPLIIFRIFLISALTIYLFYFNEHPSWRFPLILIISGAIGNVIDFFVYGHVVDMFHFVLWGFDFPIFNLADSAITIGITMLFILSWYEQK